MKYKIRIAIFVVLTVSPLLIYLELIFHCSISAPSLLTTLLNILSAPGLVLAFAFDNIVCRRFFNFPLEGISYSRCDFYDSPIFAHVFFLSSIIISSVLVFIDKIAWRLKQLL